jgi:hypothetical protein
LPVHWHIHVHNLAENFEELSQMGLIDVLGEFLHHDLRSSATVIKCKCKGNEAKLIPSCFGEVGLGFGICFCFPYGVHCGGMKESVTGAVI